MKELTLKRMLLIFFGIVAAISIAMVLAVATGGMATRDAVYSVVTAAVGAGGLILLVKFLRSAGARNGSPPGD